ncbi:MAG: hypothetical protein ABGX16_08510, partial [Pirellulales bacterium]
DTYCLYIEGQIVQSDAARQGLGRRVAGKCEKFGLVSPPLSLDATAKFSLSVDVLPFNRNIYAPGLPDENMAYV